MRIIDFLKIDVEGAEFEVLLGARHVLERDRPIVLCEIGVSVAEKVTEFLQELNYVLYDAEESGPKREPLARATWNTIAVPR